VRIFSGAIAGVVHPYFHTMPKTIRIKAANTKVRRVGFLRRYIAPDDGGGADGVDGIDGVGVMRVGASGADDASRGPTIAHRTTEKIYEMIGGHPALARQDRDRVLATRSQILVLCRDEWSTTRIDLWFMCKGIENMQSSNLCAARMSGAEKASL
jgi:hypothetical protein